LSNCIIITTSPKPWWRDSTNQVSGELGAIQGNAALQLSQSVIVFVLLGFFMVYVSKQYAEIERNVNRSEVDD